MKASILKAKEIPLEVLRQLKTTKNCEIISFAPTTYNPNNQNVFPIIKSSFHDFQYFKTMSNIFQKRKVVNSSSQAPNLGRLLYRSKFGLNHNTKSRSKNCGKNCVSYPYLLKASLYQFKRFFAEKLL